MPHKSIWVCPSRYRRLSTAPVARLLDTYLVRLIDWPIRLDCPTRLAVRHRNAKAVDQRSLHQRLMKVALHPPGQHALLQALIRIGGDQDGRDCVPTSDQMVIKLDTRH